jgi:hypothetical protein
MTAAVVQHKTSQKQLPTLVGPAAGSFVQRLCQFISLGPKLPTASGGPGRISDGLLEAINLLMLMKKSCVGDGFRNFHNFRYACSPAESPGKNHKPIPLRGRLPRLSAQNPSSLQTLKPEGRQVTS